MLDALYFEVQHILLTTAGCILYDYCALCHTDKECTLSTNHQTGRYDVARLLVNLITYSFLLSLAYQG